MVRLILLVVVVLLLMVGALAIFLFQWFGWKGLIAFPFILLGVVWVGKIIIVGLVKKLALSLFSMKSSVLQEATMTVHSVTAVSKPPEAAEVDDEDEDADAIDVEEIKDDEREKPLTAGDSSVALARQSSTEPEDEEVDDEEEKPKEYFAVDVTIVPKGGNGNRVWEPGELILTAEPIKSLQDLEDGEKDIGSADQVEVWDGSKFEPDDEYKYPGTQRLKVTFAVNEGTRRAWVQYYEVTLGPIDLPPWQANG